ncbi:MAG: cysteine desulfurase NifS [Lentisphaerae bacterium GWF2_45_14]|nr:MAG: cysteine desulfurase NifS [Lentisphaerae bacterium GWF2_45_14]
MRNIYLDNAASTAMDERVIIEMMPYFRDEAGNPSSLHSNGKKAHEALEKARADIASCLNAEPDEIIFTSSGTESNNLATKGCAFANRKKGKHIIISQIEHECVTNSCTWLKEQGFDVTYLPVDSEGLINTGQLNDSIKPDTILVSIMHANNEIGVIEPVEAIGKICRERDIYFHTDACQSFGKIPFDVKKSNIDMATINAHKIYGPKGVGALYVRRGVNISAWQHGGGQESGIRSGTENVPGIVGFAKAAKLSIAEMFPEMNRLISLRDKIIDTILEQMPTAYLNGHRNIRIPNNVNIGFRDFEGQAPNLLTTLDAMGIAVSTGSACSSKKKSSHVLLAIGRNPVQAIGALRISMGRFTTESDVDYFLSVLPEVMKNMRSIFSRF